MRKDSAGSLSLNIFDCYSINYVNGLPFMANVVLGGLRAEFSLFERATALSAQPNTATEDDDVDDK